MPEIFRFNDTLADSITDQNRILANEVERRLEQWLDDPTFNSVSVTNTASFADGTVGAPSIAFTADLTDGIYHSNTFGTMGFSSGGVLRFSVHAFGATVHSGTFTVNGAATVLVDTTDNIPILLSDSDDAGSYYIRWESSAAAIQGLVGRLSSAFYVRADGTHLYLETENAFDIYLRTTDTNRWRVTSAGVFAPIGDDTYDIGISTNNRVSRIYCVPFNASTANTVYWNSTSGRLQYASSTARFKENILDVQPPRGSWLAAIAEMQPKRWRNMPLPDWMPGAPKNDEERAEDRGTDVGLIAEDVVRALGPDAAILDERGGLLNYKDRALLMALVGAVNEIAGRLP